jgi:hypothetical protein
MSDVIQLKDRRRETKQKNIIKKIVNGEVVECVNIDALTPDQFSKYFSQAPSE